MQKKRNVTLSKFGKVASINAIIDLQKDLPKPRFSDRVVLEVEFIKPVERVLMGVHIERVDGQIVGAQLQRLENLLKR